MRIRNSLTVSGIAILMAMGAMGNSARANTVHLYTSDTSVLGEVIDGVPGPLQGQENADQSFVNQLISMTEKKEKTKSLEGKTYYLSDNTFGTLPLPSAVLTGDVIKESGNGGTNSTIQLPKLTSYQYLVATYDGTQGGAMVWYIGNIEAGSTIIIPGSAIVPNQIVDPDKKAIAHGLSHYSLFDPTIDKVPDSGLTIAMMGAALTGLGLIRRKLS